MSSFYGPVASHPCISSSKSQIATDLYQYGKDNSNSTPGGAALAGGTRDVTGRDPLPV